MQGLRGKLPLLESFLAEPRGKFLAVCLSEHWLTGDEMRGCAVSGYAVAAFFSRSIHIRGGVAILVRSDVRFECSVTISGDFSPLWG